MAGKVTLVGAGPGDPGLLTVKGRRALENAEVVVFDRLVGPQILALIPETARTIDVGKEASRHLIPQEQINEILLREGQAGHQVVRLKGGDPFVFGRGGEELLALQAAGIPWAEVPGVSSAIAIPALAGIPVTHRGLSRGVHIVTAHTQNMEDGLPDHLDDLGPGTLRHQFGKLPRVVRTVLEHADLNEFPCIQCFRDGLGESRRHAGFSDLKDRIHGHGKAF